MERPADVLDIRENLRRPFVTAISLHGVVLAGLIYTGWIATRPRDTLGDPNSLGGGAYAVTPVSQIPMPLRSGPKQPVANDTESEVPAAAKPEPRKRVKEPPPDAIPMPSKKMPKPRQQTSYSSSRGTQEPAPNQVTSASGAAASSPIFAQAPGAGGVGVGPGAPFGQRFGGYAQLIRDRIAREWRTDQVDPRMQTAPPVIVTFEILRNGQVRSIRMQQSSGILSLDNSAQRAIQSAAPFPELPAGYDRDSAVIEIWFQLKR
jgi:periplasmic protein TonB